MIHRGGAEAQRKMGMKSKSKGKGQRGNSRGVVLAAALLFIAHCLLPSVLLAGDPSASSFTAGWRFQIKNNRLVALRANPMPYNPASSSEVGIYNSIFDPINGALRVNASLGSNPNAGANPTSVLGYLKTAYDPTNGALFINCVVGCGGTPTFNGLANPNGNVPLNLNGNLLISNNNLPGAMALGGKNILQADYTDASSASLQSIPAMAFQLSANLVQPVAITCDIMFTQATQVADSFGVQAATYAPTSVDGWGTMTTGGPGGAAAIAPSVLTGLNTTTATAIVTATPTVATVNFVHLFFTVQNPSNASPQAIFIMVQQATAGDLIVIKKGSVCSY